MDTTKEEEDRKKRSSEYLEDEKPTTLSLRKKLSLPQISNIDINSRGESSSSPSSLTSVEEHPIEMATGNATVKLENKPPEVTNYAVVVREIEGFLITSSHYTARDKREILAQMPNFYALETMITATNADTTPLQIVRNAGIASKQQMVLCYMVGKH